MGRSGKKKKGGKDGAQPQTIVKDKKDQPEQKLAPVMEKPLEESRAQTFKEEIKKEEKPAPQMQTFSMSGGFGTQNTFKTAQSSNSFGNSFGTGASTNLPVNPKLNFSGGFINQQTNVNPKLVGVQMPPPGGSQLGSLSGFSGFGTQPKSQSFSPKVEVSSQVGAQTTSQFQAKDRKDESLELAKSEAEKKIMKKMLDGRQQQQELSMERDQKSNNFMTQNYRNKKPDVKEEKKILDWNHVSDDDEEPENQIEKIQLKKKVSHVVPKEDSVDLDKEEVDEDQVGYEEILKLELHLKALKQTEYQIQQQQLKQKSYDDQILALQKQYSTEDQEIKKAESEVQEQRNVCLKSMMELTKHQIYQMSANGDSNFKIEQLVKNNSGLNKEIATQMKQSLNQEMQKSTHLEEVLKSKNTEIKYVKEDVEKIEKAQEEYDVVLPKEKNENHIQKLDLLKFQTDLEGHFKQSGSYLPNDDQITSIAQELQKLENEATSWQRDNGYQQLLDLDIQKCNLQYSIERRDGEPAFEMNAENKKFALNQNIEEQKKQLVYLNKKSNVLTEDMLDLNNLEPQMVKFLEQEASFSEERINKIYFKKRVIFGI